MNYITVPIQGPTTNAMIKPKTDVEFFLNQIGFQSLHFRRFPGNDDSLTDVRIEGVIDGVRNNDIIVFQTPFYTTLEHESSILRQLRDKGAQIIGLIHDIEALRIPSQSSRSNIKTIISYMSAIIVPSKNAADFIKEMGFDKPIIIRQLWDYLDNYELSRKFFSTKIYFTGNLDNATFLENVPDSLAIEAYGRTYSKQISIPSNVDWRGPVQNSEISSVFKSGWGLVWNGESSKTISGDNGNYLKYIWPHKLSLYIESGLPSIVWSGSHASEFVENNKVGITINSLSELSEKLTTISEDTYNQMVDNCERISKLLRTGFFTKLAVFEAISSINIK